LADDLKVASPLLDSLIDIFAQAIPMIGDRDVAAILEFFEQELTDHERKEHAP
jgi:hypothetical protein